MSCRSSFTSFDQLATETLFQIFDYLPYIDAINAFFSLNHRFNAVLLQYHRYLKTFTTPTRECPFWQTILSTIASQIEHLVITATEFSLSLDSFPDLKSLVISSSFPIDYDELGLLLESEQFKKLRSLKIKSEIVKDMYDHRKVSFRMVLQNEHSLRTFESFKEQGFSHRNMEYLRLNRNLRSLSLKFLDLQCLSALLSYTPNLKYLNAVLSHFGADDFTSNLADIHLKQCSMIIQSGVISTESFPLLTRFIKQFASSLIELSLDLHQIKTEKSLSTGLVLRQQLLQTMVHLKSFHLYLQLDYKPLNLKKFLSTFQSPFWLNHQWAVGMHGPYLYTLPVHFDTLHGFTDFDQIISSNTNILRSLQTWSHIKSIEFSKSFKFHSNLNKQLKTKMPNLASAIFIPDLICNLSKNVREINRIDQKLDGITTIQCPPQCLRECKDYLPRILPNIRYFISSYTYIQNPLLRNPMVVLQELDTYFSDDKKTEGHLYPYGIECVEIKVILHNEDGIFQDVVRVLRELLEMSKSLQLITFYFYHLPRFPSILPYTELQKIIELFNMGKISEKYRIKHVQNYMQFVRKNVE